MTSATIIDALYCIARKAQVTQVSECVAFQEDLTPAMDASGIAGAVLAHGNCWQCQHQWNCADRRTHEIVSAVERKPGKLRGLASYDALRVGESLRWIDEAVGEGGVSGAYADAECSINGLDAPRMYPLYGLCAKLRMPVVLGFHSAERWAQHLSQVEVLAADLPDLDVLLAPPQEAEAASILRLMRRYPRISFLLCPEELQADAGLCDYIEMQGRERALFRSGGKGWAAAVEKALGLPLSPAALRAYLSENATRVYGFPVGVASLQMKS